LHGELEESLKAAQDKIETMSSEMEKHKALTERLENDLLSMNKHGHNGDVTPSEDSIDVLAGLDLGKRPGVSFSPQWSSNAG
jgi:homeobox protein cut-like